MSILSDFEDRVGRAIEGVFSGVFRSPVQPAEIARAAAKEMERSKRLGVGKVYAPTAYSVLLSPEDAEQLGRFTDTLARELETYLASHAAERGFDLTSPPRVRFLVDDGLTLGRFEVIGELQSSEEVAEDVFAPSGGPCPDALPRLQVATVTVPGISHDVALSATRSLIGRLKTCDICLQDANASREHAVIERTVDGWTITDLDSLNGTLLNGRRIEHASLADGDVITVGVTELVFHEPRG